MNQQELLKKIKKVPLITTAEIEEIANNPTTDPDELRRQRNSLALHCVRLQIELDKRS